MHEGVSAERAAIPQLAAPRDVPPRKRRECRRGNCCAERDGDQPAPERSPFHRRANGRTLHHLFEHRKRPSETVDLHDVSHQLTVARARESGAENREARERALALVRPGRSGPRVSVGGDWNRPGEDIAGGIALDRMHEYSIHPRASSAPSTPSCANAWPVRRLTAAVERNTTANTPTMVRSGQQRTVARPAREDWTALAIHRLGDGAPPWCATAPEW